MLRHRGSVIVHVGALLALTVAPAQAQTPRLLLPEMQLPTTPPAHLLPPITDPLALAVAAELRQRRAGIRSEPEQGWLTALTEIYGQRRENLIWVTDGRLNERARAAIEEIGRAADYGLDPRQLKAPDPSAVSAEPARLARAEVDLSLAVLTYAHHANGGRVNPADLSDWLDQRPRRFDAKALLGTLAGSADAAASLRRLHPQHPQFEALRQALLKARNRTADDNDDRFVTIPSGPGLRPGMRHPHVALVRKRLGVAVGEDGADYFDDELADAVRELARRDGRSLSTTVGPVTRASLNRGAKRPPQADVKRILVNMERWRYLPADLGLLHVWNNLPEFETRVVKAGRVVHQERIIIGKPDTQTPVFSGAMRFVVFQPDWILPPSLKVKKLLSALQDGDEEILERNDMRIMINGKEVEPDKINWDKVDIRDVPIVQAPGPKNPLGQMKFMFPNRHAVYMHDTPEKGYFSASRRTYSSGCIRVRNPQQLAELVMGEDKGWTISDVTQQLQSKAKPNNRVDLQRSVPVHNVYFTMVVNEGGEIRAFEDVYGHDRRMIEALDGRPVDEIKAEDPALKLKEKIDDLVSGEERETTRKVAGGSANRSRVASRPFSGDGNGFGATVMRLQPPSTPPAIKWQPAAATSYKPSRSREWANRALGGSQN